MPPQTSTTYDFRAFLRRIDPLVEYNVETLTGGFVNLTVRATKTTAACQGNFSKHQSLVLKYAPPYMASLGPSVPFSQDRQLTESRALALFASSDSSGLERPSDSLVELGRDCDVIVPALLSHDPEEHVLVIEDLGSVETLADRFVGLSPFSGTALPSSQGQLGGVHRLLGRRVGIFFKRLHSPEVFRKVEAIIKQHVASPDVVFNAAVMPIKKRMEEYNIPNLSILFARVVADYHRELLPDEESFVIGDLHPRSILVDVAPDIDEPQLSVIDWEFSGPGRGPHSDISELLVFLHLFLLDAEPSSARYAAVHAFSVGLASGYWGEYASEDMSPLACTASSVTIDPFRAMVYRSALIIHGRDMINQTVELPWKRLDPAHAIRIGASFLEKAKDSLEEFMQPESIASALALDGALSANVLGAAWMLKVGD